jgi:enamine deaminase RidA (YjgF/YER057c/UK114 family)
MANFDRMNAVYRRFFSAPHPTRTTVQSVLWHHIMVEIDVIALRGCGAARTT